MEAGSLTPLLQLRCGLQRVNAHVISLNAITAATSGMIGL
jgi:hypothetical protein